MFESINIVFNKPNEPCIVLADKNQFRRVLNNLINNAIEASQENEPPKIIINLTKTENNLLWLSKILEWNSKKNKKKNL